MVRGNVSEAASVMAKASWRRNAKRKAMVNNKKKRDDGKVKRRKQVKKMMKEVDKKRAGQRTGAAIQALPNAQKKQKRKRNRAFPVELF